MFQEVNSQTLKSARLAMMFLCAHRTGLQMGSIATQLGNLSEDISAELAGRGHQQEAEYVKVSELAPMIGRTTSAVYKDIADGAIEGALKVGPRTWRIPISSAEAYVKSRAPGPRPRQKTGKNP